MSESALNLKSLCDGKGWIKNPSNPTGFFACRGCSACATRAVPPKPAASPPPPPVVVPQAVTVPSKTAKVTQRCSFIGQVQPLSDLEIKSRRTACKECGAVLRIADKDFSADFQSMKVPKHARVTPQVPVVAPAPVPAAVVVPEPEAMHGAADEFRGEDFPLIDGADDPTLDRHVRHDDDDANLSLAIDTAFTGLHPSAEPLTLSPEEIEAYEAEDAESQSPLVVVASTNPAAIEYRAPDALEGQLPLIRVAHTLDEVEAAGGYSVVLADPAWSYVQQGGRGVAKNHYDTMTLEDIKALPVGRLAAKNAVLFLWGTWPLLPDVLETMAAWDFQYKTCAFVWTKHHEGSGKECVGGGFWTRSNSEFCLIGVRGKAHPKRVDKSIRQLVEAPRGEHSAKPVEVRDRICKLMGDVPMIELFARDRDERFDAWGLEVPGGSDVIL